MTFINVPLLSPFQFTLICVAIAIPRYPSETDIGLHRVIIYLHSDVHMLQPVILCNLVLCSALGPLTLPPFSRA